MGSPKILETAFCAKRALGLHSHFMMGDQFTHSFSGGTADTSDSFLPSNSSRRKRRLSDRDSESEEVTASENEEVTASETEEEEDQVKRTVTRTTCDHKRMYQFINGPELKGRSVVMKDCFITNFIAHKPRFSENSRPIKKVRCILSCIN